jgi:hypothetical protein
LQKIPISSFADVSIFKILSLSYINVEYNLTAKVGASEHGQKLKITPTVYEQTELGTFCILTF